MILHRATSGGWRLQLDFGSAGSGYVCNASVPTCAKENTASEPTVMSQADSPSVEIAGAFGRLPEFRAPWAGWPMADHRLPRADQRRMRRRHRSRHRRTNRTENLGSAL